MTTGVMQDAITSTVDSTTVIVVIVHKDVMQMPPTVLGLSVINHMVYLGMERVTLSVMFLNAGMTMVTEDGVLKDVGRTCWGMDIVTMHVIT